MADTLGPQLHAALHRGLVIPAHPLALDVNGEFDPRRQRALTRYYLDAGAGGVAVGVHTTQFAIHEPAVGLYEPVLRCAAETVRTWTERPILLVAGIVGPTEQAVAEAGLARRLGYALGLLSTADLPGASDDALLARARAVGEVLPLFGFYLQPAVGGRRLDSEFWRRFAELEAVAAIKIAPFDRYATLDVVRGVAASSRASEVALYTGNDDSIVADLSTPICIQVDGQVASESAIVGGLLGQWAMGTHTAGELLDRARMARVSGLVPADLLARGCALTDLNAAVFDPAHGFAGCIAGVNTVLHRLGLLASSRCLDPRDVLSPGQDEAIDQAMRAYPDLVDAAFVAAYLPRWLA
jgi:hypothetical protein